MLDLGSGHNPHPRANVLVDRRLGLITERSGKDIARDRRPLILADAQWLPFKSKSFDLVIASQIAEHVADPIQFCKELQRVAHRGYVESPGPIGELLLGEPFHSWIVQKEGNSLNFKRKAGSSRFVQRLSDGMYAIYYAGQQRARRTLNPRNKVMRVAVLGLSRLVGKMWRSSLAQRWKYTCFEFDEHFDVEVLS